MVQGRQPGHLMQLPCRVSNFPSTASLARLEPPAGGRVKPGEGAAPDNVHIEPVPGPVRLDR